MSGSPTGASQQGAQSKSTQTFVTALVLQLIIGGGASPRCDPPDRSVYLFAFSVLHKRFRKVYEPRAILPEPSARIEPVPPGILAWLPHTIRASTKPIIHNNGLDAYMFIRFRAS